MQRTWVDGVEQSEEFVGDALVADFHPHRVFDAPAKLHVGSVELPRALANPHLENKKGGGSSMKKGFLSFPSFFFSLFLDFLCLQCTAIRVSSTIAILHIMYFSLQPILSIQAALLYYDSLSHSCIHTHRTMWPEHA